LFLQIIEILIIFQIIFHFEIKMALTANKIINTLLDKEIEKIKKHSKKHSNNLWEGLKDLTLMTWYRFFYSPPKGHLRIQVLMVHE